MCMYKTVWIVYNDQGEKIKQVTLNHKDGALYKEIEPFERKLKKDGLMAVSAESLQQEFLRGKSFKSKLEALGLL